MLDPKTSLAIDAPPIAPYDDGFSTESEDLDDAEDRPDESLASPVPVAAPRSVSSQAVAKKQPIQERQQIHAVIVQKTVQHENEKNLVTSAKTVAKSNEKSSEQAAVGLSTARKGGDITKEEHCKGCNGYLTPLTERLTAMRTAALQQPGREPPPSRQCCCCHITYPLVALTDESRSGACLQPRCYMCNWGAQATYKATHLGVKRTVNGAVKEMEDAGRTTGKETRMARPESGKKPEEGKESSRMTTSCCCRNCRGPLPSLHKRLKRMNSTAVQLKIQGWRVSPPSRQCSCCHITYPLASLTDKSKSAMCATPICRWCEYTKAHPGIRRGQAGSASTVAEGKRQSLSKPHEIIEIEDGEDEEERAPVEQESCKCCYGTLITRTDRLQLIEDAARAYRSKRPSPSRQCACCRITYPYAALTLKSRKLTHAVPLCSKCAQAGGSAVYEMLAASDEFIEAFKVENPTMAGQLLAKKESGALRTHWENQKRRVRKNGGSASLLQQVKAQTRELSQHVNHLRPPPAYQGRLMMARKCINPPRLLLREPGSGNAVASTYAGGTPGMQQEGRTQQASQDLHTRRTARWLKQFEIVDGKTVRERRLEARNKAKEHTLETIWNGGK
jgi:hypothetical protein